MFIMYDCPKCGKKDSSHDGETFCGKCEQEYREYLDWQEREEEAERKRKVRAWLAKHPDADYFPNFHDPRR